MRNDSLKTILKRNAAPVGAVGAIIIFLIAAYVYFGVRPKEGWYVAHLESVVLPDLYAIHGRWPTNQEVAARIRGGDEFLAHQVLEKYRPQLVDVTETPTKYRATLKFRHLFGGSFEVETQPDTEHRRPFPDY
jgi:hypothetical protein